MVEGWTWKAGLGMHEARLPLPSPAWPRLPGADGTRCGVSRAVRTQGRSASLSALRVTLLLFTGTSGRGWRPGAGGVQ